jgi:hypothetical protein
MPRPIFLNKEKVEIRFSTDNFNRTKVLSPMELDRKLRQKRSTKYIEAMTKLDSGGHVMNKEIIRSLINVIREELPEITIEQLPIGFIAKCYLEPPHEVHCLSMDGEIIKHYKSHESLPPLLERARSLAIHGGYAFIEVYHDCLRAVKNDGSISVVKED